MAFSGFGKLIDILKENHQTIVFTEGNDPRILEASSRLLASNFIKPILIGNPDEIYKLAEESGFNIRGANILDPNNYDKIDEMVDAFVEMLSVVANGFEGIAHITHVVVAVGDFV